MKRTRLNVKWGDIGAFEGSNWCIEKLGPDGESCHAPTVLGWWWAAIHGFSKGVACAAASSSTKRRPRLRVFPQTGVRTSILNLISRQDRCSQFAWVAAARVVCKILAVLSTEMGSSSGTKLFLTSMVELGENPSLVSSLVTKQKELNSLKWHRFLRHFHFHV